MNENNFMEVELKDDAAFIGEITFLDVCAVLDCVLDEYFITSLQIHIPYPVIKNFAKLMSTIACRSPNLKELSIFFSTISHDYCITNPSSTRYCYGVGLVSD